MYENKSRKERFNNIYSLLCILLYLCAIGVLNASSIATEGKFYGFLPFKAFTPRYIGMTFFLFLAALIGIFMAVKSYIFDRDKGFGITIGGKKRKVIQDGQLIENSKMV